MKSTSSWHGSPPQTSACAPPQQSCEQVRRDGDQAVVRYVGRHRDFVGDLVFDRDGVVDLYPDLAGRVATP